MNKLPAGQYYYVSDSSNEKALIRKLRRFFIGYSESGTKIFQCGNGEQDTTTRWTFAVPIPKKKLTPWTLETFPMGAVWVRVKGGKSARLIISIDSGKVFLGVAWITLKQLSETHERITNDSIEPCGVYDENN